MHRVERLSIRQISPRTGLHRKTIRRALAADTPPRYVRPSAGSKLDPFKDWICEQLRSDPTIQSLRLRGRRAAWSASDSTGERIPSAFRIARLAAAMSR
jgi:transposase